MRTNLDDDYPSLNDIEALQHKFALIRQGLRDELLEVEYQYLRSVDKLRAGGLEFQEIACIYQEYKRVSGPGFSKRWDEIVASPSKDIQRYLARVARETPGPDGIWQGTWPLGRSDRLPPNGCSVVYFLFDAAEVECYTGSSSSFYSRMKHHHTGGKQFAHWTAYPCPDRESAYQLEDKLLHEHKPYLNKRAGR